MSDPMTAIYDTCVEEGKQCYALDYLISTVSSARYPQPATLHTVMTTMLQVRGHNLVIEDVYVAGK